MNSRRFIRSSSLLEDDETQAAMVRRASELATDRLKFFSNIDESARWLGQIDTMHSNGALQYTPEQSSVLKRLCDLRAKRMVWERVLFSGSGLESETQTSFLGDNGPGSLPVPKEKLVKYTRTKIPEADFIAAHEGYELIERGPDWFRFSL
jgi:hypothetical protein